MYEILCLFLILGLAKMFYSHSICISDIRMKYIYP